MGERGPHRPPWPALPRLGLAAMKSAEEASLSDVTLLRGCRTPRCCLQGPEEGMWDRRPLSQLSSPVPDQGLRGNNPAPFLRFFSAAWAPSSPPPPLLVLLRWLSSSLSSLLTLLIRLGALLLLGGLGLCLPAHPGSCCKTEGGQRVSKHVCRPAQGLTPASRLPHLEPSDI